MAMTLRDKEDIKSFIKAVRIKQDALIAATYAPAPLVNTLKGDVDYLKNNQIDPTNFVPAEDGKGLSTYDFTAVDKAILAELANQSTEGFTEEDLDDVFSD